MADKQKQVTQLKKKYGAQCIDNGLRLNPRDFLDMVLVWIVVYRVLILIRHTGTVQMLSGLGILAIAYLMSIWFELFTFNWILEKFFNNLFLL